MADKKKSKKSNYVGFDRKKLETALNAAEPNSTIRVADLKVGGIGKDAKAYLFDWFEKKENRDKNLTIIIGGRSQGKTVNVSKAGDDLIVRLILKHYDALKVSKGDKFDVIATENTLTLTKIA